MQDALRTPACAAMRVRPPQTRQRPPSAPSRTCAARAGASASAIAPARVAVWECQGVHRGATGSSGTHRRCGRARRRRRRRWEPSSAFAGCSRMRPSSRYSRLTVASPPSTSAAMISPFSAVVLPAHDDVVAVVDAVVDHRLAAHAQQEVLARRREQLGHRQQLLDVPLGEQRSAGGDLAEQRQHADAGGLLRGAAAFVERPTRLSARGLAGSRRSRPRRSRFARCACTVEDEVSPTAVPISRTVGG